MSLPKPSHMPGKVALVGAGPGDAGLISWRGVECLRRADAVLYDYLVNPAILRHASAGASLICLGRHKKPEGRGQKAEGEQNAKGRRQKAEKCSEIHEGKEGARIWQQAEINEELVKLARQGQYVVRLKGGDPAVFGRLLEEVSALEAAGIAYEIVPGITAALAAGSYAGVWITQRDVASAVALITGHEGDSEHAPPLDYAALAAFPGTLVFYMGVTTAREWTAALMSAGKPPNTPAAIVRRCSWPDQKTIRCTLGSIVEQLEAARMRPPVIVVVGDVVNSLSSRYRVGSPQAPRHGEVTVPESWFTGRPLFGQRILLTRPVDRTDALWQPLTELGAECLVQPAIEISAPDDWQPVDAALARLSDFDWLVFSSVNGVQFLLDRLLATGRDVRQLAGMKLAAIGPGTAEELANYHLRVDGQPAEVYRAEALAELLAQDARGKKFLLARASRGREVLAETLRAAGGLVEQIVVYKSTDVAQADPEVAAAVKAGRIDWVTVTSSAIARSVARMFGEDLRRAKIVSISPVTTAALRELGFQPTAEAKQYTMDGVVAAILAAGGTK
ncbi:MAG TPA: uroporphyrinogen-III C-methyltransferase [Pirellulales bacterium]|nr:uroporphyrinogen-III C-methyltransferase [Pirellulales bacterium]